MDAFFNRLRHYSALSETAHRELHQCRHRIRHFARRQCILREGDTLRHIFIVEAGWAVRKRELEDGRHQILNFLLPGDLFDQQALIDSPSDHTIEAISPCRIRQIGVDHFLDIVENEATALSALWWASVQEDGIMREQVIRVGRRTAIERIAHLCVELKCRLTVCGETEADTPVHLPVTLRQIADALGLSPVHVSRTLTVLRGMGVLSSGRGISLLDPQALASIAGFEDRYLHLRPTPPQRQRRLAHH